MPIQQVPIEQIFTIGERKPNSEMVDSIKKIGLVNPLTVRNITIDGDSSRKYELLDGLDRLIACRKLKHKQIMVNIIEVSDADVLEASIIASKHKVPTEKWELGLAIRQILRANPGLKIEDLAERIGRKPGTLRRWVKLSLDKVKEKS